MCDLLDTDDRYRDLRMCVYQSEHTRELMLSRPAVIQVQKGRNSRRFVFFLQVEVLRRADGVLFVIGNTHLHFKPSEAHIKLLQTTIAARHVQNVAKQIHAEYAEWCTISVFPSLFNL